MSAVEIYQEDVQRPGGTRRLWFLRLLDADGHPTMRVGGWHCRCTAVRLYRQRYSHLDLAE